MDLANMVTRKVVANKGKVPHGDIAKVVREMALKGYGLIGIEPDDAVYGDEDYEYLVTLKFVDFRDV